MVQTKILVLGNEPTQDSILKEILEEEIHCDVEITYDAEGFTQIVIDSQPEIIIINSHQYIQIILDLKQNSVCNNIPIIFISGVWKKGNGIPAGADFYFPKPIDINQLLSTIKICIQSNS